MQIAFALGSLSENFVVEKKLLADLIANDFRSVGLVDYGVEIHLDDLSKKEILSFIDEVNFNTKTYLRQDYLNFKKYISAAGYPQHVDYLNNDYAPDLIKFMQSRIGAKNVLPISAFSKPSVRRTCRLSTHVKRRLSAMFPICFLWFVPMST